MFADTKTKTAAAVVLLALVIVPAPLLPPSGLATLVQSVLGVGWKGAYLAAAIGLHVALYGSLGVVAAFAIGPGKDRQQRLLRIVVLPVVVVAIAFLVRSLKVGHLPMSANALVPVAACGLGVMVGLSFRQHGWRITSAATAVLLGGISWAYWPGDSSGLGRATEVHLRRLAEIASTLPGGEKRFGAIVQAAFEPTTSTATSSTAIEHNRAAILALGIALGHERLARYAGLDRNSDLVRAAAAVRAGTTLRGREDWARHYSVSAALAVVESPFTSDAGGLIKEELDALTHGSGFSFGDLAADRAGTRFAGAATDSETKATAMQARLRAGYTEDDFFPAISDLQENLAVEQFRRDYAGVGSPRYREVVAEIERRLDRCAAISSSQSHQ